MKKTCTTCDRLHVECVDCRPPDDFHLYAWACAAANAANANSRKWTMSIYDSEEYLQIENEWDAIAQSLRPTKEHVPNH